MGREDVVKEALSEFLTLHSAADSIGFIDDIVLGYIVCCLEELGIDAAGDSFDAEDFTEMMEAYLPGFAKISSEEVCAWLFKLAERLKVLETKAGTEEVKLRNNDTANLKMPYSVQGSLQQKSVHQKLPNKSSKQRNRSSNSTSSTGSGRSRTRSSSSVSSDKDGSQNGEVQNGTACAQDEERNDADDQIDLLLEMFPATCAIEVTHCLCVVNGDMEKAAQLILHRQESGDSIAEKKGMQAHRRSLKKTAVVDEKKVKDSILAKYSYVDCDEDKREHRPEVPPKFQTSSKKLVRYRDSQVVSTKGERFTEIKKKEDEEQIKKTSVPLKPAKQYRFH